MSKTTVTIVLDIDGVLCFHPLSKQQYDSNLCDGHIETVLNISYHSCANTYYIPLGIPEAIRYLFKQPEIEVVFFSAGTEERNKAFVQQLLQYSLGEEAPIAPRIFSFDHCVAIPRVNNLDQPTQHVLKKTLE